MWTVSLRFDAKVRVSKANDTQAGRKEEGSYRGRPSMQMKISSSSSRFTLLLFSLLPGKNRFPACSRMYRKLRESIVPRSILNFFLFLKEKKNTRILVSIHFSFKSWRKKKEYSTDPFFDSFFLLRVRIIYSLKTIFLLAKNWFRFLLNILLDLRNDSFFYIRKNSRELVVISSPRSP